MYLKECVFLKFESEAKAQSNLSKQIHFTA